MLFKHLPKPDRQQTMLAYRIKYWPFSELSPAAKALIVANKKIYMPKYKVLSQCNETLETLERNGNQFQIVWAFNNVPTEKEWDGKSDSYLISVDFRWSAAIPGGRVALLSFELPSSRSLEMFS